MAHWIFLLLLLRLTKADECPHGMFSIPNSSQCFKYIGQGMSWSLAKDRCSSEGLVLARPTDKVAIALRKHLWENYGCCNAWVEARGDGRKIAWLDDGSELRSNLFRTAFTIRVSSQFCARINFGLTYISTLVYSVASCSTRAPVLCGVATIEPTLGLPLQESAIASYETVQTEAPIRIATTETDLEGASKESQQKALIEPGSPRPEVTRPSHEVTSKDDDEEKCGTSRNFDLRITDVNPDIEEKVVGGEDSFLGRYPWMVHLSYPSRSYDKLVGCGGSLINKRWVLTAAHCVRPLRRNFYATVKIGFVNLKRQEPQSKVFTVLRDDIHIHDEYNSTSLANDIALVRLPHDVQFNGAVRPICLADNTKIPFGGKAVAAGWGLLHYHETEIPDILQEVKLDVLAENSCDNPEHFICTTAEDGKDTCRGDSGGPLMVKQDHQWFIFGIVSHGPKACGSSSRPGRYTRVPTHLPFIYRMINL